MRILSVIKYDGPPGVLIWKHPVENMNNQSKVIVNETQEVLFVKEGRVLDILGPGSHALVTDNIPLLSALINLPYSNKSPFTAEIFYINKLSILDIKWGTLAPIMLEDPKYKIIVPVRAFGQFGMKVEDSRLFYTQLSGTSKFFSVADVSQYFKGVLSARINDLISSYLIINKVSVLEINAYLNELSDTVTEQISSEFNKYGITVLNFYVQSVNVPENDASVIELRKALSKKASMDVIGYDYKTERTFNTLENAAANEGNSGGIIGAGIGLGLGVSVGDVLGGQMKDAVTNVKPSGPAHIPSIAAVKQCPSCNAKNDISAKFCVDCGKPFQVKCSGCGNMLAPGVKFCPECGKSTT